MIAAKHDGQGFEDIQETSSQGDSGQAAPVGDRRAIVRTSRLAVADCVLAVLSWLLLPGLIHVVVAGHGRQPPFGHHVYQCVTFVVAISAVVFTVAGLAQISLSAGRFVGRGFAWTGAALMTLQVLFFIFSPALTRTRCLAFRMTCGTNLSGIGRAMLVYANDYDDELPWAGGRNTAWGQTANWKAPDRRSAFGTQPDGGGAASIGSCFSLLIKYAEVTPKSFLCNHDKGVKEFKLSARLGIPKNFELIDAWDFGPPEESYRHYSYSYHIPFGLYALTTSDDPGFAVAADRNPWIKSPAGDAGVFADFRPDAGAKGGTGTAIQAKKGNAIAHKRDGQNVLFLDSHVEFAKRAYCAVEDDNIYTVSDDMTGKGSIKGVQPVASANLAPANRKDSLLIHDPGDWTHR